MATTIDDLAAEFRAALGDGHQPVQFTRWLADVWGDTVMITHTPPMANDGPMDGRELGAGEVAIFEHMVAAIPDYHQENVTVSLDGDAIEFYEEIVGTLPDGTVARGPIHYRFTIEDGRITHAHGTFDLSVLAPFTQVTAAAGLRVPD